MTTTYLTVTDTAKMLRTELKALFPETKFSVRSSKYAGGASINVQWTDGPTEAMVKPTLNKFAGATFDGMTDMKEYKDPVDGISHGADFVFGNRSVSEEAVLAAVLLTKPVKISGEFRCDHCQDRINGDNAWSTKIPAERMIFACTPRHAAERALRTTEVAA